MNILLEKADAIFCLFLVLQELEHSKYFNLLFCSVPVILEDPKCLS